MTHGSRRTRPNPAAPPTGRRAVLGIVVLIIVIAAAAAAWRRDGGRRAFPAFPAFTKTADQNVLLVTIDTLRADALGAYTPSTPHAPPAGRLVVGAGDAGDIGDDPPPQATNPQSRMTSATVKPPHPLMRAAS